MAEAFKLFPVFYQPTNTPGLEKGPYQDYPYYIVQSWLDEIRVTDEIQPPPYEEGHFNYTEGSTVVAEGIPFRPALAIEGKKIVYYTGFYGSLITNFIDAQRITMKDLDRKSIAFKICRSKMRFIHQMVYLRTRYAIYINEWITYPIVQDIIFDKTLQHAIVLFYVRDCKGHAFLEKIDGEWVKVETTLDWCMDD